MFLFRFCLHKNHGNIYNTYLTSFIKYIVGCTFLVYLFSVGIFLPFYFFLDHAKDLHVSVLR
jgi:hypothetical protein